MTIDCPNGCLDRSMLVLSAAKSGPRGVSPNFIVTYEPPQDYLISGGKSALEDGRDVTFCCT